MGSQDSAHLAQSGGSRGSSHEESRVAGGMPGSECRYLYVSPGLAGAGRQNRLEGCMHEISNGFWSYENTYTMQPLYKVNKQYDALTREYLSNIYIDDLDSPALSERSRTKLPHINLQTTEHAEQHN